MFTGFSAGWVLLEELSQQQGFCPGQKPDDAEKEGGGWESSVQLVWGLKGGWEQQQRKEGERPSFGRRSLEDGSYPRHPKNKEKSWAGRGSVYGEVV